MAAAARARATRGVGIVSALPIPVGDVPLPATYERAKDALARCEAIDECKDWIDKSLALASYAKQAKDETLHKLATRISARATRRAGELLQTFQSPGGRPSKTTAGTVESFSQRKAAEAAGLSERQELTAVRVANVPAEEFEALVESDDPPTITNLAERGTATRLSVHFSSASPEHYTPPVVLTWVRQMFGDIPDLDPCSNAGTPNVEARAHYTEADNGLCRPWGGRVFLNPPYGREIGDWITKLRYEWQRPPHDSREIIALLPNRPDTAWFNELTANCDDAVYCSLHGRLTFVGSTDPAPFPSLIAYFGTKHDLFASVFWKLGICWMRPPRDFFEDQ